MISQSNIRTAAELLHRYQSVHSEVFGFSIRKFILIPWFFKRTDFPYLWSETEEIGGELDRLHVSVKDNVLTLQRDKVFWDYLQAFRETTHTLALILKKLSQKASKIEQYSKEQYRADVAIYEQLHRACAALGEKLNAHLANPQGCE